MFASLHRGLVHATRPALAAGSGLSRRLRAQHVRQCGHDVRAAGHSVDRRHRPGHRHGPHLPRRHAHPGRARRGRSGGRPRGSGRKDRHAEQGQPSPRRPTYDQAKPTDVVQIEHRVRAQHDADGVHCYRHIVGEDAVPGVLELFSPLAPETDAPPACKTATSPAPRSPRPPPRRSASTAATSAAAMPTTAPISRSR